MVLAFSTGVLVRFVGWRGGDSFEGPRRPPAGGARGTAGPQPAGPHAQRVAVVACRLPGPLSFFFFDAWSVEFDWTIPLLSIMFARCQIKCFI